MKIWQLIPAEWAHKIAPIFLPLIAKINGSHSPKWKSLQRFNLSFPNPLGLAGGVDKTGAQLLAWEKLGAGFVEIGTITPEAQGPNPGKILDRFPEQKALWNKMGFPNEGMMKAQEVLRIIRPKLKIPLFINIGKNRNTPNEMAIEDYKKLISGLSEFADAFVINISSPNTKGLRDLQSESWIRDLFQRLNEINFKKIPLFLKLSPDLDDESLEKLISAAQGQGCHGFILTNTTLSRPNGFQNLPAEGGLSGLPIQELSIKALKTSLKVLGPPQSTRPLIISTGGVLSPKDVEDRLELGADLVQCYTALVIEGPLFFQKVANGRKT